MGQGISIPESPSTDGLFAIHFSQYEMYDLGNISPISHFVLYDRKSKIAIDITAEVQQAPLLSRMNPAETYNQEAIELFEEFFTGKISELIPDPHRMSGMLCFEARDVTASEFTQLRAQMAKLAAAKQAHDEAIAAFETEMKSFCQHLGFSVSLIE